MIQHVGRTGLFAAALLVALAACAQMPALDKRAIQGPTAEEIWTAMVMLTTGREPSFDEKRQWDDQMDRRLSQFLAQNPQIASSPEVPVKSVLIASVPPGPVSVKVMAWPGMSCLEFGSVGSGVTRV